MIPIEFPEHNRVIAKDQPEYQNLPALVIPNEQQHIITCWKLSDDEIKKITETGVMWLGVITFRNPLQPLRLSVHKEDMFTTVDNLLDDYVILCKPNYISKTGEIKKAELFVRDGKTIYAALKEDFKK